MKTHQMNSLNKDYYFYIASSTDQDYGRSWTIELSGQTIKIYAIADGHGECGGIISKFAVQFFESRINKINWLKEDLSGIINALFSDINEEGKIICNGKNGGSTLSLVIRRIGLDLWIANVGDSEVKMVDLNDEKIKTLSSDHSPSNINEARRILKSYPESIFEYDRYDKSRENIPLYFFDKDDIKMLPPRENVYYRSRLNQFATYVGFNDDDKISVTRGIGDYEYEDKIGFISTPSINKTEDILPNQGVIIATDGFWDSWTNIEIIEFMKNKPVHMLKEEHRRISDKYFGDYKDDCLLYFII